MKRKWKQWDEKTERVQNVMKRMTIVKWMWKEGAHKVIFFVMFILLLGTCFSERNENQVRRCEEGRMKIKEFLFQNKKSFFVVFLNITHALCLNEIV